MEPDEQSLASSQSRRHERHESVTSRVKTEVVLRLLKGESVETVSQEIGVSIRRIERWKDRFLQAGSAELARRTDEGSKGWAKYSSSIWQWIWLLIALVALVSFLAVFMQRGSPE
jgi:hypothetical protein